MPTWNSLTFPDASSPQMEQILFLHDHTAMILTTVVLFILYMLLSVYKNKFYNKTLLESQLLETIWTSIPTLMIIVIAFPSLTILYVMEESFFNPTLSVKITGHQWYWSYSMFDHLDIDSFMAAQKSDSFRLMDANPRLTLPSLNPSQLLITSADVIHSWTIPSMGIKADATPGRINQITIHPLRTGMYFGFCSEICGINHSFMPITLEIIPMTKFVNWLKS